MSAARDNLDTLDTIGGKIQAYLKKSDDQRLSAALLLLQAKTRIENGETFDGGLTEWRGYCSIYLPDRSARDIRRLLKIAGADDPEAAIDAERAARRESDARRAERTRSCPAEPPAAAVAEVKGEPNPSAAVWTAQADKVVETPAEVDHLDEDEIVIRRMAPAAAIREVWGLLSPAEQTAFLDWATAPQSAAEPETANIAPTVSSAPGIACVLPAGCRYGTCTEKGVCLAAKAKGGVMHQAASGSAPLEFQQGI